MVASGLRRKGPEDRLKGEVSVKDFHVHTVLLSVTLVSSFGIYRGCPFLIAFCRPFSFVLFTEVSHGGTDWKMATSKEINVDFTHDRPPYFVRACSTGQNLRFMVNNFQCLPDRVPSCRNTMFSRHVYTRYARGYR